MNWKKLMLSVLGVVLTVNMTACTAQEPAADNAMKIGICVYNADDAFMNAYAQTLDDHLTAGGYEVSVADGRNDQTVQSGQIAEFINQAYDALIVNPVMTSAADTIVEQVKAADIPTVFINREPGSDVLQMWDRVSYVGGDAAQPGLLQGEMVLELPNQGDVNGDGVISYIMIQDIPESVDTQLRTENAVTSLTTAGVTVNELKRVCGEGQQEESCEVCTRSIAEFGKDIEVVLCNNDSMALGALQAIKDGGRAVGKDIFLIGIDGTAEALEQIGTGDMTGTVLNDMEAQTVKTVEVMQQLLTGQTVEKQYYIDYVKVTAENVEQFME